MNENSIRSGEAYELPPARRNRGMMSVTLTLAAGIPQKIGVSGDYFHVLTAPVTDLLARFDDSRQMPAYEGVGVRVYYESVELESATGQTIVVLVGFGSVFDGRATANLNVNATQEPANSLDDLAAVTVGAGATVQIAAANINRKELRVAIASDEPGGVWLGAAGVGANEGGWIEPGMVDYVATESAVYARNPGASDVVVSVLDLERI